MHEIKDNKRRNKIPLVVGPTTLKVANETVAPNLMISLALSNPPAASARATALTKEAAPVPTPLKSKKKRTRENCREICEQDTYFSL